MRALRFSLVLWLWLAPAVAEDVCDINGVARVVAVGDVHGAYDNFVTVLRLAGLVDEKLHWSGARSRLVQVGDVLDRGADSRKAMDLLRRLEGEAAKAGGRVHALLGNHEVMNMLGDLRYVSAGEYEAFRSADAETLRERYYRERLAEERKQAKAGGQAFDETEFRRQFLAETPLGLVEMRLAFSERGEYGEWLRGHDTVVKINGLAFLHGGISASVASLGCRGVNAGVRSEIGDGMAALRADPLKSLAARPDGPLWYRGLAEEEEAGFAPRLAEILKAFDVRGIVIGHTVEKNGRVAARFGGRVVMVDAGMTPAFGGHLAALEILPDGLFGVYPEGRVKIETPALDAAPQPVAQAAFSAFSTSSAFSSTLSLPSAGGSSGTSIGTVGSTPRPWIAVPFGEEYLATVIMSPPSGIGSVFWTPTRPNVRSPTIATWPESSNAAATISPGPAVPSSTITASGRSQTERPGSALITCSGTVRPASFVTTPPFRNSSATFTPSAGKP